MAMSSWSKGYVCRTTANTRCQRPRVYTQTWIRLQFIIPLIDWLIIETWLISSYSVSQSTEWLPALGGKGAGPHTMERSAGAHNGRSHPGGLCHAMLPIARLQVTHTHTHTHTHTRMHARAHAHTLLSHPLVFIQMHKKNVQHSCM